MIAPALHALVLSTMFAGTAAETNAQSEEDTFRMQQNAVTVLDRIVANGGSSSDYFDVLDDYAGDFRESNSFRSGAARPHAARSRLRLRRPAQAVHPAGRRRDGPIRVVAPGTGQGRVAGARHRR